MSMNDVKEKYTPLNEIKMPSRVRGKVLSSLEKTVESAPARSRSYRHRRVLMSAISGVAAALMIGGAFLYQAHDSYPNSGTIQKVPNNSVSDFNDGMPKQIEWNGHTYDTQSLTKSVGRYLGKTTGPGPAANGNVFAVPHTGSDYEIIYEFSRGEYVIAVLAKK